MAPRKKKTAAAAAPIVTDRNALFPPEMYWPLDRIKVYPNNPKTHPPEQVAFLARLFTTYGPDQPIVVDEDCVILKGHGRRKGAYAAGMDTFPVVQRFDLTEVEKMAMRIEDNQAPLLGGWDDALMRVEITNLQTQGYDIGLLGFGDMQMVSFLAMPPGDKDPEALPPEAPVVSKHGDVWVIGRHRIMCGDSTVKADVELMLDGDKPRLMVTDPPYGVDYDPNWRDRVYRKDGTKVGAGARGLVQNDHISDWTPAWELFDGDVAYVWHGSMHTASVELSLLNVKLIPRAHLIWNKGRIVIGRSDYHWQHEPCWYAVRKGKRGGWAGDRKQSSVWDIDKPQSSETGHSTQKPIECMARPMRNNSRPGDLVYDPFSGSGTTIIAAEMLTRKARVMELNPAYVDLAVRRWQEYAKGVATLARDGRTFDEIAKVRGVAKPKPTRKKKEAA